jgi:hypothetical protein
VVAPQLGQDFVATQVAKLLHARGAISGSHPLLLTLSLTRYDRDMAMAVVQFVQEALPSLLA